MSFAIRAAQLDQDQERMIRILERNLPYFDHRARFDWAYRKNPAGVAWSWLAVDAASGECVAVASVFPKILWIAGTPRVCGQVGDFAVDAKHRSLGPALALQRATLKHVDDGAIALCYDCPPHERGMAPFRRLGLEVTCRMGRFCRLLRVEGWLSDRLDLSARSARLAAAVPNAFLRLRGFGPTRPEIEVLEFSERFGAEFTRLDENLVQSSVTRARRAADDLNWRYADDPVRRYRNLCARGRGELLGFLVFEVEGDRANICDLFASSAEVGLALLREALRSMDDLGISVATFIAPETGEQSAFLRTAGFFFRGAVERVVAYGARVDGGTAAPSWFLCRSDVTT